MHMKATRFLSAAGLTTLAVVASVSIAAAFPLRSPQVPFNNGALQAYLNTNDGGINTATDQVDAQRWTTSVSGNTAFTLMIELSANANANGIGVYNIDDPNVNPLQFQIFPGFAGNGWSALCNFHSNGQLFVSLFDQNSNFMGQVSYSNVNGQKFGFYIAGPGGTFYSQDARNGGNPQMLTYAGTGNNFGDWWECIQDTPYAAGNSQFIAAVLLLQSVVPTPTHVHTFGQIKALYR